MLKMCLHVKYLLLICLLNVLSGCVSKQKPSLDKADDRPSASSHSADVSAPQDDPMSGERQQHGALPDLLPPQIPPRANQPDKAASDEVNFDIWFSCSDRNSKRISLFK